MTTKNTLKTVALLGLMSAILIVGGQALAGRGGMYVGLFFAVVMNFGSYFFSEKIALASYNAQPVTPTQNPDVYRRVQPIGPQNRDEQRGLAEVVVEGVRFIRPREAEVHC